MGRRCPRSKALGLARLERHRLAVMREGWLTAVRNPSSAVHGVLWDLALSDIAALDRYEGVSQGFYVKLTQAVIAERGPKQAIVYFGANAGAWPGLHCRGPGRGGHGRFRRGGRWRDGEAIACALHRGRCASRTSLRAQSFQRLTCAFAQLFSCLARDGPHRAALAERLARGWAYGSYIVLYQKSERSCEQVH